MKETLIVLFAAMAIHLMEAFHDYAVIQCQSKDHELVKKWNRMWHIVSAWTFFAFYLTISMLQSNFWFLLIGASVRGMMFWPTLNILLKKPTFGTSNHFPEKYFYGRGKLLFAIYLITYTISFFFSCQTYN
jgi:hypothetical protein